MNMGLNPSHGKIGDSLRSCSDVTCPEVLRGMLGVSWVYSRWPFDLIFSLRKTTKGYIMDVRIVKFPDRGSQRKKKRSQMKTAIPYQQ